MNSAKSFCAALYMRSFSWSEACKPPVPESRRPDAPGIRADARRGVKSLGERDLTRGAKLVRFIENESKYQ
jgi:hypothetical protein